MKAVRQLVLVLGLALLSPGCALPSSGRAELGASGGDTFDFSPTLAVNMPSARDSLYATDGLAARGGLEQIHYHHGDRVAIYILVGFILIFVVFVDLILLPFSYHRRHLFFPCCRWCVRRCD